MLPGVRSPSDKDLFSRRAIYCFLSALVGIASCSSGVGSPSPGQLTLEFERASETEVIGRIGNGTSQPIAIEGSRFLWWPIQVPDSRAWIDCANPNGGHEMRMFSTVYGREPTFVTIPPNSVVRVAIQTTYPFHHKASDCRLKLILEDARVVGPMPINW